jgi:hypothetical protein
MKNLTSRQLFLAAIILIPVIFAACGKPDPRVQEEAMVREAQKAALEEQEFQNDSLKLAATFELKKVTATNTLDVKGEDDDGYEVTEKHYYVVSDDKKVCQVTEQKYNQFRTGAVPDTLTCQWSNKYEN